VKIGGRAVAAGVLALAACGVVSPPALGAAETYQADNARTGNVDAPFAPPLGKKWIRRDLGTGVSYPVIGEGRVFVTARLGGQTVLYALDRSSGGTVWSRPVLGTEPVYADGRVFVAGNRLQAYDAATGQSLWLLEPLVWQTAPLVSDGLVYVNDEGGVAAYEQRTGVATAQSARSFGAKGGVALEDPRVYAGAACSVSLFSKALGEPAWTYGTSCGEGNYPPAIYGGKVWARSHGGSGVVLDQLLGLKVDNFNSFGAPAFAGDLAYFRGASQVQARKVDTGTIVWTFSPGDSTSSSSATMGGSLLVVRNVVYALTAEGRLIGINRSSGEELWSSNLLGSLRPSLYSSSDAGTLHGMAADNAGLVVPTGSRLTALGPGSDTPGIDDPDKQPGAQTTLTASASAKRIEYPKNVVISGEVRRGGSYVYLDDLELQASTYPFEVWTTVARDRVDSGRFSFQVGPERNTRYRVVDTSTAPAVVSQTMGVTVFMGGNVRYYYAGSGRVRVSATLTAPPFLEVAKRGMYFYRYRSRRDRSGERIGRLKVRQAKPGRFRVRGTLRVPRLRDRDLFVACVPIRAWREFGSFKKKDPCGRRRI
jgi:outer membrane protein assembly factor BamB